MKNIYIERKKPEEEFIKLLSIREPRKYILKINNKYKKYMYSIFWNTLIKYFYKVEFTNLKDDILYEIEDIYYKEN